MPPKKLGTTTVTTTKTVQKGSRTSIRACR